MTSAPYLRVNGSMLNQIRGKNVCLLGRLNNLAQDQMSFTMTSPDGTDVKVKLRSPTKEMLSDVIEVYGSVDEQGNIICMNYTTFEPSMYANFDFDLYNETIQMTGQLSNHYIQAN